MSTIYKSRATHPAQVTLPAGMMPTTSTPTSSARVVMPVSAAAPSTIQSSMVKTSSAAPVVLPTPAVKYVPALSKVVAAPATTLVSTTAGRSPTVGLSPRPALPARVISASTAKFAVSAIKAAAPPLVQTLAAESSSAVQAPDLTAGPTATATQVATPASVMAAKASPEVPPTTDALNALFDVKFSEPERDGRIANGKIQISTQVEDYFVAMPPRQDAEEVDIQDADTPDKWIKRHKDMVRLTGRHPFNSESKLSSLQAAGWLSPPSLTVVRNHGAVPQIDFDSFRLKISGVPAGDLEVSMGDLMSGKLGPQVSIPVSFICAGNRRKEQNMTKKTIGFNWGCAAIGNTVWTGVRLCDVLAALGIKRVSKEHRFVHFEGPEGELPQGDRGVYGTSIDMGWALDHERDVMLAFKQNGEFLSPDHGAPLRTLLPGCIGGRMIKWLCRMWVSSEPSTSHYHFFDNRVLPPHVDADLATKEGWWFKDEYIINHMNINSAMFEPRHNSYFKLEGPTVAKTMKVCGYAYSGGGNKVIRAEISLDSGKIWELTDLSRPEDEIAAARGTDKHWCWAWWETEVEAEKLKDCKEICCRAVDSKQNMQPMFLTWNVMGMMNNCIFRIKVHQLEDGSGVWFEHPTMPGNQAGGWMTEDAGKFDQDIATECAPGATGKAPNRPVAAVWDYA